MNTLKYLLLFLPLVLISCNDESNTVTSVWDYGYLTASWTNSYEEETASNSTKIFRLSNYRDFPSSRYREMLIFSQDGNCSYLVLASNDGHYLEYGKWIIVDYDKHIIEILKPSGAHYKNFQVVELSKDLLKIVMIY